MPAEEDRTSRGGLWVRTPSPAARTATEPPPTIVSCRLHLRGERRVDPLPTRPILPPSRPRLCQPGIPHALTEPPHVDDRPKKVPPQLWRCRNGAVPRRSHGRVR